MALILIAILSYLLGSIPFSYLVARAYGKNLYQVGSGNVGTANVWRATGKVEAMILALLGDLGKGVLAVFLAQKFPCEVSCKIFGSEISQAVAAFFAVAGHNWPIFLKFTPLEKSAPTSSIIGKIRNFLTGFKGGRGLATLAGIILFLNWKVLLLVLPVIGFCIFLTELVMRRGIKLEGTGKAKIKSLFSIFISQVLGRMIGILAAFILVYRFWPETFKIIFGAAILAGVKHIKRTKTFLAGKVV